MENFMEEHILEAVRCENTGGTGLILKDCRPFQFYDGDIFVMFDAVGIAHDLIEHVNGLEKIGSIEDEFEALGAMYFTRGQFGDLRRDGTGSAYSTEENIASDITRMARMAQYEYMGDVEPCEPSDVFEDAFAEILAHARKDIPAELDDADDDDDEDFDIEHYLEQALHGMRRGAQKQAERFETAYQSNNCFWNIVDAVEPRMKALEEGMTFRLTLDDDGLADCEEFYEGEARCGGCYSYYPEQELTETTTGAFCEECIQLEEDEENV